MTARTPAAVAVCVCVMALGLPCHGQETFAPVSATCGAGRLSPDEPVEAAGDAYPIFMTLPDRSEGRIHPIAAAWKAYGAPAPADDKAFAAGWLKVRVEALKKAGMDVILEQEA